MRTLIVGIGNELLEDEGVGIHAVRLLSSEDFGEHVQVVEAGTAILDLLPYLADAERLIILDAMKAQECSGSIYRVELASCSQKPVIASMHGFDIFRVMALAGCNQTPEVVVYGVEPHSTGWSMELTSRVQSALPELLDYVRREIKMMKPWA